MSVFDDAEALLGTEAVAKIRAQARAAKPLTEAQLTILTALLDFDPNAPVVDVPTSDVA